MGATMSGSVTIDGKQMYPLDKIGAGKVINIGDWPCIMMFGTTQSKLYLLSQESVASSKWGTSNTNATNMWSTIESAVKSSSFYTALSNRGLTSYIPTATWYLETYSGGNYHYILSGVKGYTGSGLQFALPSQGELMDLYFAGAPVCETYTWLRANRSKPDWFWRIRDNLGTRIETDSTDSYSVLHYVCPVFYLNIGSFVYNHTVNYSMPDNTLQLEDSQEVISALATKSGTSREVVYTYSNSNANHAANRLSVMITDKEWETADANVLHYAPIATEVKKAAKVTFTIPEEYVDSEFVYLIAEQKNSGEGYATYPALMEFEEGKVEGAPSTPSTPSSPTISPDFSLGDANDILDPNYAGRVSVDFINEIATFNNVDDYKIEYANVKLDSRTYISNIKLNQWEDATGESQIDLSWISKSKESALIFKFTDTSGNVVFDMLPCKAQDNRLKVGLATTSSAITLKGFSNVPDFTGNLAGDSENGFFYFYTADTKNKIATPVSASAIQWRKGTSGIWVDEETVPVASYLNAFKNQGAALYFRLKSDGKAWNSKEVKYSFKKQANAPKVTISTKDNTISLKAGQEYKIKYTTGEWSDWIPVDKAYGKDTRKVALDKLYTRYDSDKSNCTVLDLDAVQNSSGGAIALQVRTAANQVKSTRASKASSLTLSAPATGTIGVSDAAITVKYTDEEDTSKGITLTNNTELQYEYALGATSKHATKWKTLAPGRSAKVNSGAYTSRTNVCVRIAGDAKAYKLPSASAEFSIASLSEMSGSNAGEVSDGSVSE